MNLHSDSSIYNLWVTLWNRNLNRYADPCPKLALAAQAQFTSIQIVVSLEERTVGTIVVPAMRLGHAALEVPDYLSV